MLTTKALRQAAAHAERTPLIKFIGRRSYPSTVDHSPHAHPASPTGQLPQGFAAAQEAAAAGGSHASFSTYRDHAQQFGPLRKTIRSDAAGVGGTPGSELGPVSPPQGMFFDRSELPARFRRTPIDLAEMEAVESGGAALLG